MGKQQAIALALKQLELLEKEGGGKYPNLTDLKSTTLARLSVPALLDLANLIRNHRELTNPKAEIVRKPFLMF